MSKTIAYLRVSTTDQDTEKNKNEILSFANDRDLGKVEFIQETVSGKVSMIVWSGWTARTRCLRLPRYVTGGRPDTAGLVNRPVTT